MIQSESVDALNVNTASEAIQWMKKSIGRTLFGLEKSVDELLIALLSRGHILLEDVPGVGKTALAKTFAQHLGLSFHRVQCTPDLLPADIVGGLIYHPGDSDFILRKGPIFANLILVDEINRALPRTQSALLEAMAEGQVTIDGKTHLLPTPFLVIATQNPIESQGVFPLPEAQLDRFLMKTSLGYPSEEHDVSLLRLHLNEDTAGPASAKGRDATDLERANQLLKLLDGAVDKVVIADDVLRYISQVIRATREHPDIEIGASPRAAILLAKAARSAAVVAGREFVTPDDVQRVAHLVLFHRLVFHGHISTLETDATQWTNSLLAQVEVPIEAMGS